MVLSFGVRAVSVRSSDESSLLPCHPSFFSGFFVLGVSVGAVVAVLGWTFSRSSASTIPSKASTYSPRLGLVFRRVVIASW